MWAAVMEGVSLLQGVQLEEEEDMHIIPEQQAKSHDGEMKEPQGSHIHPGVWAGGPETTAL